MRLWSLHPKYLDTKGLLAVWREGLLAKKVLAGKTLGYVNHPQLIRFKQCSSPSQAINCYQKHIFLEALRRGYKFDKNKIDTDCKMTSKIPVSTGQIDYEWKHLLHKLKKRNRSLWQKLLGTSKIHPHPLFKVGVGGVAEWEVV